MTKINVGDLDRKLREAGIPIVSVRLTKEQKIELLFTDDATEDQRTAADQIVRDYDQDAEDALKAEAEPAPLDLFGVSEDEIKAATTIKDIKDLLLKAKRQA